MEGYTSAFKKYISHLLKPKFPEIINFDVEKSDDTEWNFSTDDWMEIYNIIFYVDGTEKDFELDLYEQLGSMIDYLGFTNKIRIHYKIFLEDGSDTGTWAVV